MLMMLLWDIILLFQSTPPGEVATKLDGMAQIASNVSIHATG